MVAASVAAGRGLAAGVVSVKGGRAQDGYPLKTAVEMD